MTMPAPAERLPANHRLVHEVLSELEPGRHLAADEIFERVRARRPGFGYSTVYRALERLCVLKLIKPLHLPGADSVLYEAMRADHSHFVCSRCGRVEDVALPLGIAAVAAELVELGCEAGEIAVTVHGRCTDCRAGEA